MKIKKISTGPQPTRLKIDGDWTQAIEKTLKKAKPAEGWVVPKPKKRAAKAKK